MSMSFVSETSQYWKNLSYMIIFGLPLGTVLTLVVVPTIYSLIETARRVQPDPLQQTYDMYGIPTAIGGPYSTRG